ncbi:MAG: TetR/AcrR family transcriptional regulator [Gammaproteobacteria bacterium]
MNAATADAASGPAGDIRTAILDAAQARFLHFGYHKTTMAEIAEDSGMSAANLYRYFDNKLEIVAQCAARCMDERLERLRVIVAERALPAPDRLARYALELVADSHALAGPDSHIGELVGSITRERPALVHDKEAVHHALIAQILADGVAAGDFAVDDVDAAARHVHAALTLFDVPLFVGLHSRAEFDALATGVVELLLAGLRP